MDRIQPGAGVRHRVHHRLPGGEAGREPQQEPDAAGEGRLSRHNQNGGGALLLVSDAATVHSADAALVLQVSLLIPSRVCVCAAGP